MICLALQMLVVSLGNTACGGGGGGDGGPAAAANVAGGATSTGLAVAAVDSTGAATAAANLTGTGTGTGTGSTAVTVEALAGKPATAPVGAAAPVTTTTPAPPSTGIDFSFTLDAPRTTSAAVYAADGSLVRTLWRGERLGAGTRTRNWDQRDDLGQLLPAGDFTIKLIHHDISYVWEGVVGNTSARPGATAIHRSFGLPTSLAADTGRMHYAVGYNEGQNAIQGFNLSDPQTSRPAVNLVDPFTAATMVATDGVRLYWTGAGGLSGRSFIAAYELASGKQALFSQGQPLCLNYFPNSTTCYGPQTYNSVLELRRTMDSPPSGLAVQKNGRLLAVAYGNDNQVRLYDKTSGQLLRTLSMGLTPKANNQLAFAPSGDLWVLTAQGAQRYTGLAGTPTVAANIVGLSKPLAITVDAQDEDSVWIADGGTSQQLKRHDRLGSLRQVIGVPGGMQGNSAVATDRLCFTSGVEQAAVAVDDNHAVWTLDACNNRLLQFTRAGSYASQIAYVPASYTAAADAGNPTRVFANYLEFAVDYSKGLGTPGSWTLVRNWLQALPAALRDGQSGNGGFGGFRSVQTLPNGRTYAQIAQNDKPLVVELKADGSIVLIKTLNVTGSNATPLVLYENGDLGNAFTANGRQSVQRYTLDRYDALGQPVWSTTPVVLASVPAGSTTAAYPNGVFAGLFGGRFPVTESNKVVFFNPGVDASSGFHLGAADKGGSSWSWQASPSGALDGLGTFQTKKADPTINYGGNVVMAAGRSIVYGYHGEFYTDLSNGRVGQANQFMHFRDDGLFLGQFGVSTTRAATPIQAGLSGNAFSPTLLRYGGQTYLYHNDESTWGGVHRWRLSGVDGVQELVGKGSLRSTLSLR